MIIMEDNMNRDDVSILKSVQKNTEMAMKAIDTIEPKVQNRELAMLLTKTSQKYSDLHQRAVSSLVEAKAGTYKGSTMENMMLVGGIHANTLMNSSTSHIAELMINGSNMGITDLNKAMNHHKEGGKASMEIARELLELEKYNLEEYKKYL